MAEFERGPRRLRRDIDRIPDLFAMYDVGQDGRFRIEGICELYKSPDLPPRPNISLPFTDESILIFSQGLWGEDPNAFRLAFEGVGTERKLKLLPAQEIYQGLEIILHPRTIRVIDQVRSGIFRVGEAGTIFIDLPESKVGNLTLLNDPDIDFQINPPLLTTEDVPASRLVIDVKSPFYYGQELTVLLFRELAPDYPDAVVLDQLGSLVEKRVRRIIPNML